MKICIPGDSAMFAFMLYEALLEFDFEETSNPSDADVIIYFSTEDMRNNFPRSMRNKIIIFIYDSIRQYYTSGGRIICVGENSAIAEIVEIFEVCADCMKRRK